MTTKIYRSLNESPRCFTHKFVLTHADLTEAEAAKAQDITLITLPANSLVVNAATYVPTAFKDASDNAFTSTVLIVGDSADPNRIIAEQELNVNGTEITAKANANTVPYAYPASTAIVANVASMAEKALADVDTGEVHIFLQVVNLANIS